MKQSGLALLAALLLSTTAHAQIANDRIMDALVAELAPLRKDELRLPRYTDPTRPISVARRHRGPRP